MLAPPAASGQEVTPVSGIQEETMILAIFRSRVRPGVERRYLAYVEEMEKLARAMPGYISDKAYYAEDGERLSVHEWESAEALRAWREHPEHAKAQAMGRDAFYDEYTLYVCDEPRESRFKRMTDKA
jgi:heme-degrading monooxygenase HmoA